VEIRQVTKVNCKASTAELLGLPTESITPEATATPGR
jgi:hypothetical protein